MKLTDKTLITALLFQANWFVCVFVGSNIALASTCLLLIIFFINCKPTKQHLMIMLVFASIGFLFDSFLSGLGFIHFAQPLTLAEITFAPLWLLLLWLSFSTCLHPCLTPLFKYKPLLLGLITFGIPLNYWLGARLTETQFDTALWIPLGLITLYWLITLPFTLSLLEKQVAKHAA